MIEMMDKIKIDKLVVFGTHGVYPTGRTDR